MTTDERMAEMHKVKAEQVTLGCGSTEVLKLLRARLPAPAKNW